MGISVEMVEVERLRPNDWNPNVMSDKVLKAERESIEQYGFIDPITVRPHPDGEGLQIVDGEHRWRVACQLEMPLVPTITLDLDDKAARKLTVILNETRGRADVVELAGLLAELSESMEPDELLRGMPFSEGELEEMLEMSGLEMPDFSGGKLGAPSEPATGVRTIQFTVDEKVGKLWDRVQKESAKRHGKSEAQGEASSGVVFERVLRDWLRSEA